MDWLAHSHDGRSKASHLAVRERMAGTEVGARIYAQLDG